MSDAPDPSRYTLPKPNPGSVEAVARGCTCPELDNARGRGYMGGAKDKDGSVMFVMMADCPLHGESRDA